MREIAIEQRIDAPRDRVWALLSDHEGMTRWMPVREVVRRHPGSPEPDGVGAVRTIRGMGMVIEERVTDWKPGERLGYTLTEGAPIRDHAGEVVLVPQDGGTLVRWRVRFRPLVPGTGWLIERALGTGLARGLRGLKALAEAPPAN